MRNFMICGGVMVVCAVLTYMMLMFNAAEGYEDNDGFHYGRPEDHSDDKPQQ